MEAGSSSLVTAEQHAMWLERAGRRTRQHDGQPPDRIAFTHLLIHSSLFVLNTKVRCSSTARLEQRDNRKIHIFGLKFISLYLQACSIITQWYTQAAAVKRFISM